MHLCYYSVILIIKDSEFDSGDDEYVVFVASALDGHSTNLKIDNSGFYNASESAIRVTTSSNMNSNTNDNDGVNMKVTNSEFATTVINTLNILL